MIEKSKARLNNDIKDAQIAANQAWDDYFFKAGSHDVYVERVEELNKLRKELQELDL